ncbi:DUF1329 domain-containing protein [Solimonas sp. SE-A11]|uniref:DUF1329 domain-containing protein n=1 Tax=Solimonas sp. SE-A11 TaxID=3054954 RepID=UPI00259CFC89|nr:DUF1329 domain-containing protein [Solimonas sp. SE-A11]MDM4769460.1 DUF1329 domain-containing protein [Solimonas sp. SE-A11]
MKRQVVTCAALVAAAMFSGPASAVVSAAEAGKLGKELTEVGAERAGNKDGTIPAYVGKASFSPEMLKITRAQLEDLRVRLVKDIQAMISDAGVVGDILNQGQAIMDAEPAKADKVIAITQQMLTADPQLKAEFDKVLKTRGGKSVDGLIASVKSRQVKLPALKDDIIAVIQSMKGKQDWMSRLVKAFDIARVLEILAIVDDPKTRVQANELLIKYTPSYVKGFLQYNVPGKPADPLASMRPLYVITKANLAQYDKVLTDGHKAMFKTYPDYKMIVFPSYRNAFFPDEILKATVANATRATLVGTDDVQKAELGFPFPIPKSGAEPIWNHKLKFRGSAVKRYNNQAIVKPDGSYKISKLVEDVKLKYANLKEPAEMRKGGLFAYYLQEVLEPPRVAGQIILVHETAGGEGNSRLAWIYSPGLGRVNRAPDVGFDNPSIGSDGEQFNDQIDVFNGSLERFDWKLIGKREMLIPYNSWMLNSPTFKYKDIIRPGHINQDLARYEMHRVWVVEATLKQGQRHRFGKRRFYLDEDSWAIAAVDCYDNRGQLWKVQEAHLLSIPFIPTVSGIPETIYDLQSKRYFVTTMTNEDAISDFEVKYDDAMFTPAALQRKAKSK